MVETTKTDDPKIQVMEELTARLSKGADFANKMRIDLYVMDLVKIIGGAEDLDESEIVEQIKSSQGFADLNTTHHISDETTLSLMREVKAKLSGGQPK